MKTDTKKFLLQEKEIPEAWYNILPDMPVKPQPLLDPATKRELKAEDLYPLFAEELAKQEMNTADRWIEIPEEVRDMYKIWRPTPLPTARLRSLWLCWSLPAFCNSMPAGWRN